MERRHISAFLGLTSCFLVATLSLPRSASAQDAPPGWTSASGLSAFTREPVLDSLASYLPVALLLGIGTVLLHGIVLWPMIGELQSLRMRCQGVEEKLERLSVHFQQPSCDGIESLLKPIAKLKQQTLKVFDARGATKALTNGMQQVLQALQSGTCEAGADCQKTEEDLGSALHLANTVSSCREKCRTDLERHQLGVTTAQARAAKAEMVASKMIEELQDEIVEVQQLKAALKIQQDGVEMSVAGLEPTDEALARVNMQLAGEQAKIMELDSELSTQWATIQQAQNTFNEDVRSEIASISKGLAKRNCEEAPDFVVGDIVRARDGLGSRCAEWGHGVVTSTSPLMVNRKSTGYPLAYDFVEHVAQEPPQQRLLRLCRQQNIMLPQLETATARAKQQLAKASEDLHTTCKQSGLLQINVQALQDAASDLHRNWQSATEGWKQSLDSAEAVTCCAEQCQSELANHELHVDNARQRSTEMQQAVLEMEADLQGGKEEVRQLQDELETCHSEFEKSRLEMQTTQQGLSNTSIQLGLEDAKTKEFGRRFHQRWSVIKQAQHKLSENVRSNVARVSKGLADMNDEVLDTGGDCGVQAAQQWLLEVHLQQKTRLLQFEDGTASMQQQMAQASEELNSAHGHAASLWDSMQTLQQDAANLDSNWRSTEEVLASAVELAKAGIGRSASYQAEFDEHKLIVATAVSHSAEAQQAVLNMAAEIQETKIEVDQLQAELQGQQSEAEQAVAHIHDTELGLVASEAKVTLEKSNAIQFESDLNDHWSAIQKLRQSFSEDALAKITAVSAGVTAMKCDRPFQIGDIVRARNSPIPGLHCGRAVWRRGAVTSVDPLRVKRDGGHPRPWEFVEHFDQGPTHPYLRRLCGQQCAKVEQLESATASGSQQVAQAFDELAASRAHRGCLESDLQTVKNAANDLEVNWQSVKDAVVDGLAIAEAGIERGERCREMFDDHEMQVQNLLNSSVEAQQAILEMTSDAEEMSREEQRLRADLQARQHEMVQLQCELRTGEHALNTTIEEVQAQSNHFHLMELESLVLPDDLGPARFAVQQTRRLFGNTSQEMRHVDISICSLRHDLQTMQFKAAQLQSLLQVSPNQTLHFFEEMEVSTAEASTLHEELRNQESHAHQLQNDLQQMQSLLETEQESCVICRASPGIFALTPCGHRCLCAGCESAQTWRTCPICRVAARGTMRVYD